MSKDPFDSLPDSILPPPLVRLSPEEAKAAVKSTLPRHLRRDFSIEFSYLDKALKVGSAYIGPLKDKATATSWRLKISWARSQHRIVHADTAAGTRYDEIVTTIQDQGDHWVCRLLHSPLDPNYEPDGQP